MPDKFDLDVARMMGKHAFERGETTQDNPFNPAPVGCYYHSAWLGAFEDARRTNDFQLIINSIINGMSWKEIEQFNPEFTEGRIRAALRWYENKDK